MYIVACATDPLSYAEFDCILDAAVYYDVAIDSLPPNAKLVIINDGRNPCNDGCHDCPDRRFPAATTH